MSTHSIPKNQLIWQCRRGMLELDTLLGPFLEQCYERLSIQQQADFVELLRKDDPSVHAWLYCIEPPPEEFQEIVHVVHAWRKARFTA
jgi:succinate dehydrogenase flavin-adding protein (antitoxin of CptAB toxin-antitoxin module)